MSAELEIRAVPYGHPDAQALIARVQEVYVDRYGGADDDPMDDAMFSAPDGAFFVGYLSGVPVVTGAWRVIGVDRLGSCRTAEIKRMYVVPEVARRGHARTMLAHLESTAATAGLEVLVLSTGSLQPEAIALYRSSGYAPITPFGHYAHTELVRCFGKRLATGSVSDSE